MANELTKALTSLDDVTAWLRQSNHAERVELGLALGDQGRGNLSADFEAAAAKEYRELVFGDPEAVGSIEEMNYWLSMNAGKCFDGKTRYVVSAINYLRREFGAVMLFKNERKTSVPCCMTFRKGYGGRGAGFGLVTTGQPQRQLLARVTLPRIQLK